MNYLSDKYDLSVFNYYVRMDFVKESIPEVIKFDNGVICPDNSFTKPGVYNCDQITTTVAYSQDEIVYLGYFSTTHFGNLLIDYISSLWYADIHNYKYAFTSRKRIDVDSPFYKLLSFLKIDANRLVRIETPTRFKCVYVPSPTFCHAKYVLPAYKMIFEKMKQNVVCKQGAFTDKVYLTRTHLKRHKEIGEKRFEKFFEANGFTIVAPEELPIEDQIQIFLHAKIIASLEGTHAHGVVWSRGGERQIILRKQTEVIPRQMMLNQLWKIKTEYVDVFEEPFKLFPISHDRGPFLLRWTNQIEQFAKDKDMFVPDSCRKGYSYDLLVYMLKCGYYWIKHSLKKIMK